MILFHEMRGRPVEAQEMVGLLLDMLDTLGYVVGSGAGAEPAAADEGDEGLLALALAAVRHFSLDLGSPERTNRYQRESLQIAARLPDGQAKAFALLLNGMGPGVLNMQQSCALSEQCIGIFTRLDDGWGTALAQLILADVAGFGGGEHELARSQYQASLEGFTKLGNEWGRAMCLTGLSHLEHRAGHLEEAYRMRSQALDTYLRMGDPWRVMMMHQDLGEMAEEMGVFDEARRHYEANLAHFTEMGDERPRDEYRARLQRLDERAGLAPDLAAEPVPRGAVVQAGPAPLRSVARAQPGVGEPEALVEPLSAREIEVLELLAEGLSNREIAQRLHISPNTVRVHNYHIYGKLGVSNRTQATARGRASGLLPSS
jgi:DNA-binding CsgD family transcriptional regulator